MVLRWLLGNNDLQQYDAVEIRRSYAFEDEWEPGYWILKIEKDGNCLISRPFQGDSNITQLSFPVRYSPDQLRKAEEPPKLKVTGGIYKAENFLKDYGAFVVRGFYRDEEVERKYQALLAKRKLELTKLPLQPIS